MRTVLFWVLVVAGIGALLPPLFTHGACTEEFNAVGNRLETAKPELLTLTAARAFLAAQGLNYQALTAHQCHTIHPADVETCPPGVLLIGAVPVKDRVCRWYRDDSVRFQLGFNETEQLIHIQTDMRPYRIMKLPITDFEIDVAK